jgi:hypothetical protein
LASYLSARNTGRSKEENEPEHVEETVAEVPTEAPEAVA